MSKEVKVAVTGTSHLYIERFIGESKYNGWYREDLNSDIEGLNAPIIVCSQYGWKYGCKETDYMLLFPPFKYELIKKGGVSMTSKRTIACSKAVDIKVSFDKKDMLNYEIIEEGGSVNEIL